MKTRYFQVGFFLFLFGVMPLMTVQAVEPAEFDTEIKRDMLNGNFAVARSKIDRYIYGGRATPLEIWNLNFRKDQMDRIERDFRADPKQVLEYIRQYYPDVTTDQLAGWKESKALEVMTIDGVERYFHAAAPNLFRIDSEARRVRLAEIGQPNLSSNDFLREHFTSIHAKAKATGKPTGHEPRTFRVTYTLTVPADTVPEGEVLRCWLPYPRSDHRRQTHVVFIDSNLANPVFSPPEYAHCTVYSEKTAVKGEPTVFQIQFQYQSTGEWFDPKHPGIQPYNKESELYKHYTAERTEHVVFTEELKRLSEKIVGDEKSPAAIVEKIYDYITVHFPWASSREYSTMFNIPSYMIENKHGDCGMIGLLMIALCRYNGIPAKWQSGFVMYPGSAGLHDWAEIYFEGIGWVPADPSIGQRRLFEGGELSKFLLSGTDSYRWIVNEDYSRPLYPAKIYPRSETVDFQRGEVEWRGGNLYFSQWRWRLNVEVIPNP